MGIRKTLTKTKYPGVYFKTDPKTKVKTFIVRIKNNGTDTEQIVGYSNDLHKTNASLAYQRRTEIVNKLKAGKSIRRDTPSLDEFFDEYIELRKKAISQSWYDTNNIFFKKHIPLSLRNKKIKEVTSNDLQKVVNKLVSSEYSGRYIKTVKEIFSPMLKKAQGQGLIEDNIIEHVEFPKFDNEKKFYLSEEKTKELYQEILNIPDNQYRLMFLFLLRGRRKGEVLSLEWQDISFSNNSYIIRDENNKIRENMTYLLDDELIHHFGFIEKKTKGLVFPSKRTKKRMSDFPRKLWAKITEKLEIEMSFHDFRHLIGFTLVQNDVSLETISRTLGHKSIKTTQRYSNMKEEMAKIGSDTFVGLLKK
jgi:integrase